MTAAERITQLEGDLKRAQADIKHLTDADNAIHRRLTILERYLSSILGALTFAGFLLGIFASAVKKKLGLD